MKVEKQFKYYNKLSISANFVSLILSCIQLYGCIAFVDNMSVMGLMSFSKTFNRIKDTFGAEKPPTVMSKLSDIKDIVIKKN